jgi:hypothetical protein
MRSLPRATAFFAVGLVFLISLAKPSCAATCDAGDSDCQASQGAADAFNAAFDRMQYSAIWSNVCRLGKKKLTENMFLAGITSFRQPLAPPFRRVIVQQTARWPDPNMRLTSYYRLYKVDTGSFPVFEALALVPEDGTWRVCDYNFWRAG